jgi:hypothetical protein
MASSMPTLEVPTISVSPYARSMLLLHPCPDHSGLAEQDMAEGRNLSEWVSV